MNFLPVKLCFLLEFIVCLITSVPTNAASPEDSIRMSMQQMKGQELLQAHSNLCRLAAAGDNPDKELTCLRAFIEEANRQGDAEAEGQARSMQMMCYYNYYMPDSLKKALPVNLRFMGKHALWDHYYNSWNTLVELYIYEDRLQTALREAEKMYADARRNKSNYGVGVSAYCVGGIYQTMGRFGEARKSLEESVEALSKEEDISLLLSAYNALGETLDGMGNFEELRRVAVVWQEILDRYKKEAEVKGYTPSLGGRYLYCTLAAAVAEIETKQYAKASQLLEKAEQYADGRKQIARFKLLQVQARYYVATHQYEKAIVCNKENMNSLVSIGDSVSLLTVQIQQADFFLAAGQYKAAAELYKEVIPRKDKLRNAELTAQLDELRTIFEVDKLTLKNKITTNRLYFAAVCSALLLVVVILIILYNRRLRRKNRILYDTIVQSQKVQDNLFFPNEQIPEGRLDNDEVLYRKLCQLMLKEQLFRDPQMKREDLAARLNTNRTYLADAIRKCAEGLTFTEYLNRYRLRYAATLLTENPDLSINEVGDDSGFNSRSTYNRLFRDYYGMSPSEYRSISKEKKRE